MCGMKQKILIIEDDEILSKVIKEELEENDFEVIQAFDGEEGLNAAQSKDKNPDLILLDIMMPKMDGFEVLQSIKANEDIKNIPVFILTVLGSDEDIKKGIQLGAKDYIVKSQHAVSEIVEKIDKFMETAV